jgi:hypothetical protein
VRAGAIALTLPIIVAGRHAGMFGSYLDAPGEDRDPFRDMGRIEHKCLDAFDEVRELQRCR